MNTESRTRRWQAITLATLLVGYSGYYVCRSNLAAATPELLDKKVLNENDIGRIVSFGTLAYAVGKIGNAFFPDRFGGRVLFTGGMLASVAATVGFGLAQTYAGFMTFWMLNRYVQSAGWSAMMQISSRWYPARRQATVIAVLSMSYLVGDAAARQYLGRAMTFGANWREVFMLAAGTLGAIAIVSLFTLRSSPRSVGLEEPAAPADNLFGQTATRPASMREVVIPLLSAPSFWLICTMNFGLCLIRGTFDAWSTTYLTKVVGLEPDVAVRDSMYFPLFGGVAVLAGGIIGDWLKGKYGRIAVPSLIALLVSLIVLAVADLAGRRVLALVLMSAVGFFMMAPYSYCAGVMAVELGGKKGSSTAAGVIDCAGYVGGVLSGFGIAGVATSYGWQAAFYALAGVAVFPLLAAVWYCWRQEFPARPAPPAAEP